MKIEFINSQKNSQLIIFFDGWGRDSNTIKHLNCENFDVVHICSYDNVTSNLPIEFETYEKCHLVSWSLGVYVGAVALKDLNIKLSSSLAINGTLLPIDDSFGISKNTFDGTINSWDNEKMREKFNFRIASTRDNLKIMPESLRDFEEQKNELIAIKNLFECNNLVDNIYQKAIIGANDRIFLPEMQCAFWSKIDVEFKKLNMPHYPFFGLKSWSEVLELGNE